MQFKGIMNKGMVNKGKKRGLSGIGHMPTIKTSSLHKKSNTPPQSGHIFRHRSRAENDDLESEYEVSESDFDPNSNPEAVSNTDGSESSDNSESPVDRNISNDAGQSSAESEDYDMSGRGPARMHNNWGTDNKLPIVLNQYNQAIGSTSVILATQMGIMAKDGNRLPLTFTDWRYLPDSDKESCWLEVKANTDVEDRFKKNFLKRLGKHWRDWKAEIKREYYTPYNTDAERLANRPPRVDEDQWPILVEYWGTEKVKKRSKKNKKNRKKQKMPHYTGRKSFANVREEMRAKIGVEPSKFEVYEVTHTPKDGPMKDEIIEILAKAKNDHSQVPEPSQTSEYLDKCLEQALGGTKAGYVRTFGLGPTQTDVYGPSYLQSEVQKKAFEIEVTARVKDAIEGLETQIRQDVEGRICSELEASMQVEIDKRLNGLQNQLKSFMDLFNAHMKNCPIGLNSQSPLRTFLDEQTLLGQHMEQEQMQSSMLETNTDSQQLQSALIAKKSNHETGSSMLETNKDSQQPKFVSNAKELNNESSAKKKKKKIRTNSLSI